MADVVVVTEKEEQVIDPSYLRLVDELFKTGTANLLCGTTYVVWLPPLKEK